LFCGGVLGNIFHSFDLLRALLVVRRWTLLLKEKDMFITGGWGVRFHSAEVCGEICSISICVASEGVLLCSYSSIPPVGSRLVVHM